MKASGEKVLWLIPENDIMSISGISNCFIAVGIYAKIKANNLIFNIKTQQYTPGLRLIN
jgi:hypothetical protein